MSKPESKQDQIVAFLRAGNGDDLTNPEVAAQFDCNEGTVRRARRIVEAERQADQMVERGASSDDALEALRAILAADELEETLLASLDEVKEELKTLKESLKDASRKARDVRRTVRENHPLFDRGVPFDPPSIVSGMSPGTRLAFIEAAADVLGGAPINIRRAEAT